MIRVRRGTEPNELPPIRRDELRRVGGIATGREPTSDEIGTRYAVASQKLYEAQFFKCCFCEFKEQRSYNDVEHYRPKAEADRAPGSGLTHGYWWLAWTWENLLFACATCNRSHKRTRFPLNHGSVPLMARRRPPGREQPLLIDPSSEDPIEHIEFIPATLNGRERWSPRARNGSPRGRMTIEVAGLDRPALLDHYDEHVAHQVRPRIIPVEEAIGAGDRAAAQASWKEAVRRLLNTRIPFTGLYYDALAHYVPQRMQRRFGLALPRPSPE